MPLDIDIVRCDPNLDRVVFDLASRSWPATERSIYENSIRSLIETGREHHIVLVAARQNGQLVTAQIGQVLPGRVAVVWPPCFNDFESDSIDDELIASLFQHLASGLAASDAQIAQALLSPGDELMASIFAAGGFSHAASLLYMASASDDAVTQAPAPPFGLAPFRPGDDPRLIEIIERTYVGTLDCPSIDGLRQTADVVAGYQAIGVHRHDLWHFVRYRKQDVGCLLVNLHPDVSHAEIIYLALVPEVRGRGWGRMLAEVAKKVARDAGYAQVVLAVDATNRPALALYEQAGLEAFDRREIWIKQLATKPQSIST